MTEGDVATRVRALRVKAVAIRKYARVAVGGSVEDVMAYPEDIRKVSADDAIAALRRVLGEDKNYIEAHLLPEEEAAAEEGQTDE